LQHLDSQDGALQCYYDPLLPLSRLLLPRSGLERSDFVLWPNSVLLWDHRRLLEDKRTRFARRETFRVWTHNRHSVGICKVQEGCHSCKMLQCTPRQFPHLSAGVLS
jgi:hypothetical protein